MRLVCLIGLWVGAFGWAQDCRVATLSDIQLNYLRLEVSALSVETARLERIRSVIEENCLSLQQLKDLLWALEQESARLEVIKFGISHVYNPQNLEETLSELFVTESGKQAFRRWLSKYQQQH